MKYYTTIEQSKKLVKLGIDIDTADMINMCYSYTFDGKEYTNCKYKLRPLEENEEPFMPELNIPCWSTEALLKLLPREINRTDNYILDNILVYPNKGYCISYRNLSNYENKEQIMYVSDTLLECAFEMIVKLKELKLI